MVRYAFACRGEPQDQSKKVKLDEKDSEYTKDLLDQTGNWKGFEWLLHELKSYTDTKGERKENISTTLITQALYF